VRPPGPLSPPPTSPPPSSPILPPAPPPTAPPSRGASPEARSGPVEGLLALSPFPPAFYEAGIELDSVPPVNGHANGDGREATPEAREEGSGAGAAQRAGEEERNGGPVVAPEEEEGSST